jgi:dynein heavy chain
MAMLFLYYAALVCITGIGMLVNETKFLAKDIMPLKDTCQRNGQLEGEILQSIRKKTNAVIGGYSAVRECEDGLWYRVAHCNMSDSTQQCPPSWREYNRSGVKACGRPVTSTGSCPDTVYSTNVRYTRVCGRVVGYLVTTPDTVHASKNINGIYLDGVSITHGSPRRHIWSYIGAWTEMQGGMPM